MPMLEVFGYGSVGVIFLLALFIELLAQRGTLSHATAAITSFAVTAGVGGALVFMIALPDVVLGVLLFALSFFLWASRPGSTPYSFGS